VNDLIATGNTLVDEAKGVRSRNGCRPACGGGFGPDRGL